jgi:ribA/ribD-fused uncharacterized protein
MTDNRFSPRSIDDLLRIEGEDGAVKFLFFWGHQPSPGGGVGRGCLSQWWPAPFEIDGKIYPTAEHYMMAAKARLFGDDEMARQILATARPGAAKALGRQVAGFDEATWKAQRYAIVVRAGLAKFEQHSGLRDFLLQTGHRVLVEASPIDLVWGIGLAADDERAERPAQWRGQNLLGFALMDVRATLRAG